MERTGASGQSTKPTGDNDIIGRSLRCGEEEDEEAEEEDEEEEEEEQVVGSLVAQSDVAPAQPTDGVFQKTSFLPPDRSPPLLSLSLSAPPPLPRLQVGLLPDSAGRCRASLRSRRPRAAELLRHRECRHADCQSIVG
ncbi:hypothetical protein ANANG_G00055050 [Anguilla anguilla]|uniref:Uncharacterized protein n=1 Tax=Anguilla anguilla TaxID=7936 RepID=A0A9D3MPT5_ANGAN|nr:hypothetical protein ANANG_G00055050 [Anguilla anguilla]